MRSIFLALSIAAALHAEPLKLVPLPGDSLVEPYTFTSRMVVPTSGTISGVAIQREPAPSVDIIFAPGIEAAEIAAIKSAKSKLRVQMFTFTSAKITAELVAAHARGVDVAVLMDANAAKGANHKVVAALVAAGVPLKFDGLHAIAHIKMMIVDGLVVLTGSFNFTEQAEHRNAEMIAIIRSADAAERCNAEWNLHNGHAN